MIVFAIMVGIKVDAERGPITTTTITISFKEFTRGLYLVWDTDGNAYRADKPPSGLFGEYYNSPDDYYRLEVGSTYNVILRGKWNSLTRTYPNIVSLTLADRLTCAASCDTHHTR